MNEKEVMTIMIKYLNIKKQSDNAAKKYFNVVNIGEIHDL